MLYCPVTVNGEKLCYYEDVRNFVKTIDPHFYNTFGQLFPTPGALDDHDFNKSLHLLNGYEKTFIDYTEQYKLNYRGAVMCSVLRLYTDTTPDNNTRTSPGFITDTDMSDVYSPSIEALITQASSQEESDDVDYFTLLREAFSQPYIDPHDYVGKIVKRLRQNMNEFTSRSTYYVAPYTSLVTSSMMGKSRLMKELAQHVPLVYICLRGGEDESQFPPTTTRIRDWVGEGACKSLDADRMDSDIASDNNNVILTLRYSLFLVHLMDKLSDLITEFRKPTSYPEIKVLLTSSNAESFAWMWDFFADAREPIALARQVFWTEVLTATVDEFRMLRSAQMAKTKRPPRTSQWASAFLTNYYPDRVDDAHEKLQRSFNPGKGTRSKLKQEKRTLIICFDEARFLCDTSALTGVSIIPKRHGRPHESSGEVDSDTRTLLYSNFLAMRRAFRYLAQKQAPQIFGLFTNTTSRLTHFQRRSTEESTGHRFLKLPGAGTGQFDPIYIFTSIDAHSQIIPNNLAISDHRQVAKAERLLKFGRAGWYSLYSAEADSNSVVPKYTDTTLLDIAVIKLLGGLTERKAVDVLKTKDDDSTRLNWLALLGCRLAIAVGPFSREAEEMVSSHLAVLLKTDEDRHFLKTYYPSEPILGEASATITARTGWAPALKALYHHLQNGIIGAGYRGELLSKVLCLIAMDSISKPFIPRGRTGYWAHTQPVKVRDFLNGWLASPSDDHEWFCDALLAANHRTNKTELRRFLDGYVFFNHFVPSRSHFIT